MNNAEQIKPVTVISASAGTGKTHTLAQEYVRGLEKPDTSDDSAGIIATTFTNKAAGELVERVRRTLINEGRWSDAQGVLSGYLGTVNSICGRLVSEHALESGLSPDFTVISEQRLPVVFAVAVDSVVHQYVDGMKETASRLKIENWRDIVQNVIDLARNNDLGPSDLRNFSEHSWSGLRKLLPTPAPDETAESLDSHLADSLETTLKILPAKGDVSDLSTKAKESLQDIHRRLTAGNPLIWQDWAVISTIKEKFAKPSKALVQPLCDVALNHSRHPRLHEDLRTVIFGVFNCAADAMEEYTLYKRSHGLIDFIDQELLALKMLQLDEVRDSFREKAKILLVDEFQDTSPIQLAVFLEMAKLVDYSVWVGDDKQSIFSFRGSDPELMNKASKHLVEVSDGTRTKLAKSYRSRPSLVKFTNAVFSRSAKLMDVTADSVMVNEVKRADFPTENLPLHLWWLDGGGSSEQLDSLVSGIELLLSEPHKWPTIDKHSKESRYIRGSDIAILCRTNYSRNAVAKALTARGLTTATQRECLMDTPECILALASLRFLVDQSDTLALAELVKLQSDEDDNWLAAWIHNGKTTALELTPYFQALEAARDELFDRSPSEVLEIAISKGGVLETAMSWGTVRQRFANLDALRGLARDYETHCDSGKSPATAAGLISYLYKIVPNGGNQSANPDENGINILTYHKSKGLEWPLVILYDLHTGGRSSPFDVAIETSEEAVNPLKPLEGRRIRFWPWPYGNQRKNLSLGVAADKTKEGQSSRIRNNSENLRLLYVGMTRARDYLIFACHTKMFGTSWLDMLQNKDDDYQRILTLPLPEESSEEELIDGVPESKARISRLSPSNKDDAKSGQKELVAYGPNFGETVAQHQKRLAYTLSPSTARKDDFSVGLASAAQVITIGTRLRLSGTPDMRLLGECVHAFLAADDLLANTASRLSVATRILHNWKVSNISSSDLLECSDRLANFLKITFPGATWNREFPVAGRFGIQRLSGSIDLLLERSDGYIIIDHKTFPGRFEEWEEQALSHATQLALYKFQLERSSTKPVLSLLIHMPIVGAIISIDGVLATADGEQ